MAEGVVSAFDAGFSNATGDEDASKMLNPAESISIVNGSDMLSIDARQSPLVNDTIFLNIDRLSKTTYFLQIFAQHINTGVKPYLEDTYLHTRLPLLITDTNNISFTIDPLFPVSLAANRFRIVISEQDVLPMTFESFKAVEKNKSVELFWNVVQEDGIRKYEVERSFDGLHFIKVATLAPATNIPNKNYSWPDPDAITQITYYRIMASEMSGLKIISKIIMVKPMTANAIIKILPNPVTDGQVNINISDLEKGECVFILMNAHGQQLMKKTVYHAGGTLSHKIINSRRVLPARDNQK